MAVPKKKRYVSSLTHRNRLPHVSKPSWSLAVRYANNGTILGEAKQVGNFLNLQSSSFVWWAFINPTSRLMRRPFKAGPSSQAQIKERQSVVGEAYMIKAYTRPLYALSDAIISDSSTSTQPSEALDFYNTKHIYQPPVDEVAGQLPSPTLAGEARRLWDAFWDAVERVWPSTPQPISFCIALRRSGRRNSFLYTLDSHPLPTTTVLPRKRKIKSKTGQALHKALPSLGRLATPVRNSARMAWCRVYSRFVAWLLWPLTLKHRGRMRRLLRFIIFKSYRRYLVGRALRIWCHLTKRVILDRPKRFLQPKPFKVCRWWFLWERLVIRTCLHILMYFNPVYKSVLYASPILPWHAVPTYWQYLVCAWVDRAAVDVGVVVLNSKACKVADPSSAAWRVGGNHDRSVVPITYPTKANILPWDPSGALHRLAYNQYVEIRHLPLPFNFFDYYCDELLLFKLTTPYHHIARQLEGGAGFGFVEDLFSTSFPQVEDLSLGSSLQVTSGDTITHWWFDRLDALQTSRVWHLLLLPKTLPLSANVWRFRRRPTYTRTRRRRARGSRVVLRKKLLAQLRRLRRGRALSRQRISKLYQPRGIVQVYSHFKMDKVGF